MKKAAMILALALTPFVANAAGDAAAGKAKAGVCAACHGAKGISAIPTYPNLAGQKAQYLELALKGFRDKSRKGGQSATMYPMAAPLSDADIKNLAAYYSSLK